MTASCDFVAGASNHKRRLDVERTILLGPVRGSPPRQRGAALLEGMVVRATSCLRQAAGGGRAQIVRYGRFLANAKVTLPALLAGWSEQTALAAAGRHVLAIQDTSEINFQTTSERRRGLGEIGKGGGRGVLLHAMLALDADTDACLGLVAGEVWTRAGRVTVHHDKRPLEERESRRWLSTPEQAKEVLRTAAAVTVIDDREGDIYDKWASVSAQTFHLLTRSMHDRALAGGLEHVCGGRRIPHRRRLDRRLPDGPRRSPGAKGSTCAALRTRDRQETPRRCARFARERQPDLDRGCRHLLRPLASSLCIGGS